MKIKKYVYMMAALVAVFLISTGFTACQSIVPYEAKSKVEQQIAELNKAHEADKAKAVDDVSKQKDKAIDAKDLQLQTISNSLYAADAGFKFYPAPGRLDIIINNRVNEAWVATGKTPTYDAIVKENQRLKDELDTTKTSMEQLKKDHDLVVDTNKKIADEGAKQVAEIARLQKVVTDKDAQYQKDKDALNDKLKDANDKIQAALKEKADNQASIERLKTKLMIACGAAAVLCLLGAIYSPVGKGTLGMLAAVFGGATVAIPFIEGWMVLVAVLILLATAIGKFLYDHNTATNVNKNLIGAVQDTKENDPETYAKLQPTIQSWNTTYVKDAIGNTVSKVDAKAEAYIKTLLMHTGRLDVPVIDAPKPTPEPTSSPTPTVL